MLHNLSSANKNVRKLTGLLKIICCRYIPMGGIWACNIRKSIMKKKNRS